MIRDIIRRLLSQDRSVANARAASTHLSQRLVEQEEVRIFLEEDADRRRGTRSA